MTNAEKYLKDGVSVYEFINEYADYYVDEAVKRPVVIRENLKKFLQEKAKPTLTEDERIILRNVKNFTTIIRNIEGNIQVENEDGSFACLCAFNHLFQFIKVGEKHEIKELLQDD